MQADGERAQLAAWLATAAEVHALRRALAGEPVDEAAALDAAFAGWHRVMADPRLDGWTTTGPEGGSRAETVRPARGGFGPGEVVGGRYRVLSLIGAGGMGEVWRAFDLSTSKVVALKRAQTWAGDEAKLAYFKHEVLAAGRVVHENVVRLFGTVAEGASVFMVMELLDGKPLRRCMDGMMGVGRVRALMLDACAGMAAAHAAGVIHRDLKPENMLVVPDGMGGERLKIIDFGLAVLDGYDAAGNLTGSGPTMGSWKYMAPEQLRGEQASPATDVWALALIVCELFAGRLPDDGRAMVSMAMGRLHRDLEVSSAVPPGLRSVLAQALVRDAGERLPDAAALGAALAAADWTPAAGG